MNDQFDTIAASLINGQRRQAAAQMQELDRDELCEMLDNFADVLGSPTLALDAAKTWIRLGVPS